MFQPFSPLAPAGALLSLACLGAAPAEAASLITFVSGTGTNTGTCANPANPCRTFQFAINQTSPGGEVKALDRANYGGMIIVKSISITGVEGASIDSSSGNAVTINAGVNDAINLSHLTLDGLNTASIGILLNAGGSLTITDCVVRNFSNAGIFLQPASGTTKFVIGGTLVSDNGSVGIVVQPRGTGAAIGALDHVSANNTGLGIFAVTNGTAAALADVTSVDSIATNSRIGMAAGARGILRLAHSAATGNETGVIVAAGGTVESFRDNEIHGNGSDVSGTLTPVAAQ